MDPSFWRRRPAVWSVLFFVTGIVLDEVARPGTALLYCMVGLAGALGCLLWLSHLPVKGLAAGSLALIVLGSAMTSIRREHIENEVLHPHFSGERIELIGQVETEPRLRGTRLEMLIRADSICGERRNGSAQRRVLVQVATRASLRKVDSVKIGDHVNVAGVLESLPQARNPGDFDYGRFLALNGIHGFVTVAESGSVTRQAGASGYSFGDLVSFAQKDIFKLFDRYHGPQESSFLKGVVFGYRGDLSPEVKQSFMETGTMHILAVSGSNVAVVALIFFSMVGFLRVRHRVATVLTLLGLVWYMVITGLGPSVVRATIMASTILFGTVLGRKGDIFNSLAFAALMMLVWDPMVLFDVGFQLSFAAVMSILCLYPRIHACAMLAPAWVTRNSLLHGVLQLAAVSIAAQIGTLPFSAIYFGRVSLIAVIANLVVVPASGLNTLLGFATIAASLVSEWVASSYAALNDVLVSLLLQFVDWSAKIPFASIEMPGYDVVAGFIYYALLISLFNLGKPLVVRRTLLAVLAVLNLQQYLPMMSESPRGLSVTILDVGQGDAILVELPNRKKFLVDTGPASPNQTSAEIAVPWLRRHGINSLEAVVLTHVHDDHIAGAASLLEKVAVKRLYVPDTAAITNYAATLFQQARRQGVPVELARVGDCLQFDASTRIFVLNPPQTDLSGDPNDRSIVLKIIFGTSALLLTGDAGSAVEQRLISMAGDLLESEVLKVSHHGSSTSSTGAFLTRVRPRLAAISVGRMNKFGHPSPATLARIQGGSAEVVRTDIDGAVILRSDGKRFELVPWRGPAVFK